MSDLDLKMWLMTLDDTFSAIAVLFFSYFLTRNSMYKKGAAQTRSHPAPARFLWECCPYFCLKNVGWYDFSKGKEKQGAEMEQEGNLLPF